MEFFTKREESLGMKLSPSDKPMVIYLDDPDDSDQIATRSSWVNFPIKELTKVDIDLKFSEDQFLKIKNGFIPRQMEDKWFIFYEDDCLYFHRSWSGFGVFKAQILKQDNDYLIREFFVESNMYSNDDAPKSYNIIGGSCYDLRKSSFENLINFLLRK